MFTHQKNKAYVWLKMKTAKCSPIKEYNFVLWVGVIEYLRRFASLTILLRIRPNLYIYTYVFPAINEICKLSYRIQIDNE